VRSEREILARLGRGGLARVLQDLLDPARLIKLANAVGLSYPGMRTQSQKRPKLVADLVDKAGRDDAAVRAIVRALRKETAGAAREWSALAPEDRAARLEEPPPAKANGRFGALLFQAASTGAEPPVEEALSRAVARIEEAAKSQATPEPPAKTPGLPIEREAARLRKKAAELQKNVRYLEGQIAKTKDVEKTFKRDLMQRKGELAEARMLAERLRKELDGLRGASAAATEKPAAGVQGLDEIERSMKKLATEQRRLAHRIEKLTEAPPPPPPVVPEEALAPLSTALADLHKEIAALRCERRKDLADQAKRLDEVATVVQSAAAAIEASPKAQRQSSRKRGDPERVGVFIDVQNMYYAARQLKGKLDFDALLAASVLDRRLIQATAYVVESKEIDQSGFIAMLQQRGIEVRRKTLKVRSDGSMKGDWDMEMALDILDMAPKLDVVVLVSGDGDFTSLVKRVKSMGPRVEVVAFPRNTAKALSEAADRFHPLDRRAMIRSADPPPADVEPDPGPAAAAK
jgi:uncharacterized LabA/DUF88 family protein